MIRVDGAFLVGRNAADSLDTNDVQSYRSYGPGKAAYLVVDQPTTCPQCQLKSFHGGL